MLLFSAVALAKWIKEVSAIPDVSLNTLSESSSWLSERNADCHSMTEHCPWALKSGDLELRVQQSRFSEATNHILIFLFPLFTCLWAIPLLYVESLISDTKHPFLWFCALTKPRQMSLDKVILQLSILDKDNACIKTFFCGKVSIT